MTATTSPSLLLRIRNPDDEDAWEQFLAIYTSIVRDYCFQRRLQIADVDDIVQEVMTTVTKAIKNFEYDPSKGRFRAWLGTVAANTIKSHLNKEAKRRKTTEKLNDLETGSTTGIDLAHCADPDSEWVEIFSERIFRAACTRARPHFSDVTWNCFEAAWIQNESAGDIAKNLGIPIHSVYVNKSRVLKRLEAEIRQLVDDLPVTSSVNGT